MKLNRKLAELVAVVASADFAPTRQVGEVFQELSTGIDAQIGKLDGLVEEDLAQFVTVVEELGIPAVIPNATPPTNALNRG